VRLRQALVACEVALATMLLVCAALFLQGFMRLQRVPLGFEPDGVTTTRISLPASGYPNAVRTAQFYDRLLALLHESGLETVAVATSTPFGPGVRASFQPANLPSSSGSRANPSGVEHIVSGGYIRALDIPVLSGRSFEERDTTLSPAVAIVSQNLARRLWPDANPLGHALERGGRSFEVVGVVGDVRGSDGQGQRGGGPEREPAAAVYFAAAQLPQRTMTLVARTSGEQLNVAAAIRGAVRQLDPSLAVQGLRPLRDWMADSVAPARLMTTLATMFAVSAVLLTSVGIYGVLAYIVTSRTREIGVRMAMGATRSSVVGLVLRDGMTWAGSGILGGLIAAYAAGSFVAALLFGVAARDPLTFAMVGGAIGLVALTACSIPALRAVRIDPTITMRAE
jgi:putative ABC transport system permease protein